MREAFKTVNAYRITVFYTNDIPTETYFKPTMAEAEAYREELLQSDDDIDYIDISEDPETIEAMNLDGVPELNTDVFPELDLDKLDVGDFDSIPAIDPESVEV